MNGERPMKSTKATSAKRRTVAFRARFIGVSVNTVRSWAQGKRPPQPVACRFLAEIEARPGYDQAGFAEAPAQPSQSRIG